MAKYIRTKEGRISYVDYEPNEEVPYYGVITNKGREKCYNIEDVIKQADTIEELCDELVVEDFDNNSKPEVYSAFNLIGYEKRIEKLAPYIKKGTLKMFGAIWTEKGLIYVAKMNEKGCLELL